MCITQGFDVCIHNLYPGSSENRAAAPNLWRLATAYQNQGHKAAKLDPLNLTTPTHPAHLKLEYYGLDPQQTVDTRDILFAFSASSGTAAEVVSYLQDMYTGPISLDVSAVTVSEHSPFAVYCCQFAQKLYLQ